MNDMLPSYRSLPLLALALIACESPKLVAPARTAARFGRDPNAVHTLALGTGNDSAALVTWQNAINADITHDTVWGVMPKGTVHMRVPPNAGVGGLLIQSSGGSSSRVVDIGGYSKDSSIIYVDSSAHAPHPTGSGAIGFVVRDPHVHFHDLAITSLADSTKTVDSIGVGTSDEGIRFAGSATAEYGEVSTVRIRGFRVAGIDVFKMKGVFIHDNEIFCAASNSTTNYLQSMGIWMRELAPPAPPGITNGTIQANTVWDCGAEGIPVADAQYVQVRWNTISCIGGQSCPQGWKDKGLPSIGIALYNDVCTDSFSVSNNRIDDNHIYGNRSLTGGIALEGQGAAGLGYNNVIDTNVVHEVLLLGISDAPGNCFPGSIHSNLITVNTVDSTKNTSGRAASFQYYDIFTNGHADTVSYNGVCLSDTPYTISGDTTTVFIGNFHNGC
jgi:hypothetical protein